MFRRKRKGMALITVVLISALLFVSIIGITLKVVPENKIIVARSSSQRALTTAETGFSQTLFDLRNVDIKNNGFDPLSGTSHYLTASKIKEIAKNVVWHITDCGEFHFSDNPYTTYYVKIKRISVPGSSYDIPWDPDSNTPPDDDYDKRDVYVQVYSLGTVYRDSTKTEVVARRVVTTECNIVYHKESTTTSESSSKVFEYGLFSGTDITFGGGAQEVNGDIYVGGNINLGNSPSKVRANGGTAYAHGQITGDGQTTGGLPPQEGQDEIPFPKLDVDHYKGLAYKFKTGEPPYNGTVIIDPDTGAVLYTYPDTTNPIVKAVIQNPIYLGPAGTSATDEPGSTVDGIQAFYSDLMAGTGAFLTLTPAQLTDLQTNAKSIVYYVNPAPGDGTGTAIINGNFECQGTIVINGDLSINGNANIVNDGGLAILVNGDIIRSSGTATLNGLFYATGGLDFGGGNFTCNGSIVTQDPINITGSYTVNYQSPPSTMPNLSITTTVTGNNVTQAEQTSSSWKEISFDEFQNP